MADIDIITPEDGCKALGLPQETENFDRVQAMVTGISGMVDELCGPVVARTIEGELYAGGKSYVLLRSTPVLSIEAVTETTGTTPADLDEADWLLESQGHYAMLHRRLNSYETVFPSGDFNVSVDYTPGRFTTTDTVSERWKAGVRSILVLQWSWEASQWARNPQGDEYRAAGPFDVEAAVRARFPRDLLPPGIA